MSKTARMLNHVSPSVTPQTQPVFGKTMVQNDAGGYNFPLTNWDRLARFLVLGTEGGTFYLKEKELTQSNAAAAMACFKEDGPRAVTMIRDYSVNGRAMKNSYCVFLLALATSFGDAATKKVAYAAVPEVCRIGTDIFAYTEAVNKLRGWSNGLRKAVARFYTDRTPEEVAWQVAKYGQRDGWSHRDILNLSHPKAASPEMAAIFDYLSCWGEVRDKETVVRAAENPLELVKLCPPLLQAYEELKPLENAEVSKTGLAKVLEYITKFGLTHEMVPKRYHKASEVWEALLPKMPLGAMVRNLGRMTASGLLSNSSAGTKLVKAKIADREALSKSRLHPVQILTALMAYRKVATRGDMTWVPVGAIMDVLDEAFYESFQFVKPTNKAYLLAVDVSGSMHTQQNGSEILQAFEAAAAMALTLVHTEPDVRFVSYDNDIREYPISKRQRMDDVIRILREHQGSTDSSLPFKYAEGMKIPVDAFVLFTDGDTWAGNTHPFQSFERYRMVMNRPNVKSASVAFVANASSNMDPSDKNQLVTVGFDTQVPKILSEFVAE